jgi:hypothetical protein
MQKKLEVILLHELVVTWKEIPAVAALFSDLLW